MVTSSILVTGATGYIGSQVVLELLERHGDTISLKVLARPSSDCSFLSGLPVDIVRADLLDVPSMIEAFAGVDTVFHCAGLVSYTKQFRNRLYDVNVIGTRHVVNACLFHGVRRLVMTSSIAAVGNSDDGTPATESAAFREWQRRNGYMEAKHLAELEALRGAAEGLDTVLLNPGVVIGVDRKNSASVSSSNVVLRMIYQGRVPVYPSGSTGFVDVRDVAAAHVEAWRKGHAGSRYIIVGHNRSFAELFDAVRRLPGSSARQIRRLPSSALLLAGIGGEIWSLLLNRPTFISLESSGMSAQRLVYSNSRSVQELGMTYRSLEQSIESAVA
ncbi:MAG: NAD-dependent epimerase/dehydratase family protein [Chlorobi bacterium]|nr:NAD-dependent epimerase/dehydratase family protein [Chlorobiota bacterium]